MYTILNDWEIGNPEADLEAVRDSATKRLANDPSNTRPVYIVQVLEALKNDIVIPPIVSANVQEIFEKKAKNRLVAAESQAIDNTLEAKDW